MEKLLPAAKTNLVLESEPLNGSENGYRVDSQNSSQAGFFSRIKAATFSHYSALRSQIGMRVRRSRVYARWIVQEFYHSPRFEIYARRMDTINRRAIIEARGKSLDRFKPFEAPSVPRVIWLYWDKGESAAPKLVQKCIESWRQLNPTWEVRVLDASTVSQYADMSDYPDIGLPGRYYANLLRLRLLKDHGGVWADATVLCHRPLDEWIQSHLLTGFFAPRDPGPGADRWIATWFMASSANHRLLELWENAYSRYVSRLQRTPDKYFMFFYVFQWELLKDKYAMQLLQRGLGIPAVPCFMAMKVLGGSLPVEKLYAQIENGLPFSKLSWKEESDPSALDEILRISEVAA